MRRTAAWTGVAMLLNLSALAACTTPAPAMPVSAESPGASAQAPAGDLVAQPGGIAQRSHGAAALVQARAARALIATATREGAQQRWARRRALTFAEASAVFALDDRWALLAQAPRQRRARLLAAMRPALEAQRALDDEERALVEAAARAAGVGLDELYARRASLDARALATLIEGALVATGALLGPVAGDVTLLPDVLTPPAWRAGHDRALPGVGEPSTGWALFYGAAPRPRAPDDAAAFARSLAVELRLAALSVRALAAPASEHDALASRALYDEAELVPGAAALLDSDRSGRVVERFVGLLRAPAVARALWAGDAIDEVAARLDAAPPADEEGYPEAFVAVARLLSDSL